MPNAGLIGHWTFPIGHWTFKKKSQPPNLPANPCVKSCEHKQINTRTLPPEAKSGLRREF